MRQQAIGRSTEKSKLQKKHKERGAAWRAKYGRLDYSRWDEFLRAPDDPVAQVALAAREEELERLRNDEFEKNNPEFCDSVKSDIAKRDRAERKKTESVERLKIRGNKLFKKRRFADAIKTYMDALKQRPFLLPLLFNIAQAHYRLKEHDDAIEFCNRAICIEANHVKALYCRARVYRSLGRCKCALVDLQAAAAAVEVVGAGESISTLVSNELLDVQMEVDREFAESEVRRAIEQGRAAPSEGKRSASKAALPAAISSQEPHGLMRELQTKLLEPESTVAASGAAVTLMQTNASERVFIRLSGALTKMSEQLLDYCRIFNAGVDMKQGVVEVLADGSLDLTAPQASTQAPPAAKSALVNSDVFSATTRVLTEACEDIHNISLLWKNGVIHAVLDLIMGAHRTQLSLDALVGSANLVQVCRRSRNLVSRFLSYTHVFAPGLLRGSAAQHAEMHRRCSQVRGPALWFCRGAHRPSQASKSSAASRGRTNSSEHCLAMQNR